MGVVFDYAWTVSVPFPFSAKTLLYWGFASLVVHVCHRLVEQTSTMSDPLARRVNASHAAICIGCLVWSLDVVGYFMYSPRVMGSLHLAPALAAMLLMIIAARLTVPALSSSTQVVPVALAGLGLSIGMVVAHVILANGVRNGFSRINLQAVAGAVLLAILLALGLALKHRAARLQVFVVEYRPLSWPVKLGAGAVIVLLHWILINIFSGTMAAATDQAASGLTLLATIMVFGMAVAVDQLYNAHFERSRQRFWTHALSRVRKTPAQSRDGQAEHQLSLLSDHLPALLTPERMQVYFQPIIKPTPDQWHQEALLRIKDPDFGVINPEVFFLACELKGMTAQVDRMVIGIALDHVCDWRNQGFLQTCISVNVAPNTLLAADFADWLLQALQQRMLSPGLLKLEMTEHGIISSGSKMLNALTALRRIGVGVVMDDFGAGYSSLGVLAELPIVGIKCDRLFVKGLRLDRRRQLLLQHIAKLAQDLGIAVTAEGVETADELQIVLQSGISSIQGYFYSAALPADQIPAWQQRFHTLRNQGERRIEALSLTADVILDRG